MIWREGTSKKSIVKKSSKTRTKTAIVLKPHKRRYVDVHYKFQAYKRQ